MIAKMINAKQILEIGTFTGFSSTFFANAIGPGGMVHTIEMNEEYIELLKNIVFDFLSLRMFDIKFYINGFVPLKIILKEILWKMK